jgi:hypothetical protein
MIDDDECAATGGMRVGKGNHITQRKSAPVFLYPLQTPHDLSRVPTRVDAMRNQRRTASAMARP